MSDSKTKRITKKQLTANCENAKKSTGPKTIQGKKRVAHNGIKFGLHTKELIIDSPYLKENRIEFDFLLKSLYDEFAPVSDFQEFLIHKIAHCLWRSRRAYIAETAIVNKQLNDLDDHYTYNQLSNQLDQIPELPVEPGKVDDMQEKRGEIAKSMTDIVKANTVPSAHFNMNILYYEMRLDRQLTRYYKILRNLQNEEEIEISDDLDEKM